MSDKEYDLQKEVENLLKSVEVDTQSSNSTV